MCVDINVRLRKFVSFIETVQTVAYKPLKPKYIKCSITMDNGELKGAAGGGTRGI